MENAAGVGFGRKRNGCTAFHAWRPLRRGRVVGGFARRAGRFGRLICVLAPMALARAPAEAGAWTEPAGQGLMIDTLWGWTGDGAPWGGNPAVRQNRAELQTYAEYGLNDAWTIFGQMGVERYELSRPQSSLYAGLDDSELGFRAKLASFRDWVVSGQASLFLPGPWNPASPAQAGNTGGAVDARMLAGYGFALGPAPGFFNLEFAFRCRSAGPPDEWHTDVTVGLKPAPGFILMLQDYYVASTRSNDRSFPSWRQNVMQASFVMPLWWDGWSLQIGYFPTVLAVRTNTERGAALAVWRTF